MPTFDTPEPISVTIEVSLGDVRVTAGDRTDTVVEVVPSDRSKEADVKAAEQTLVEYNHGKLLIKAAKPRVFFGRAGSVDVTVELPTGSHIQGDAAMADFRCAGQFGDCRLKTASGGIQVDRAGALRLNTSNGKITVEHAVGHAEVTGAGTMRVGGIDGTAVIRNINGDIWVGEVTGDLRLNTANGNLSVDRAHATVGAKTANGNVRIGEVVRGSVVMETAFGELEIGIRTGTVAWLDVRSAAGRVHNSLDSTEGPQATEETVKVRARTYSGDIVIRRS